MKEGLSLFFRRTKTQDFSELLMLSESQLGFVRPTPCIAGGHPFRMHGDVCVGSEVLAWGPKSDS